mmetsp:Transcript_30615/g.98331  ORF Transcript_30615/g.98331 Transcript_30615/m.98331 type:complete len:136 (+) Transcript_30615:78-485(+)
MLCLVASALAFRPVHVCQLTPSTSSAVMRTPRERKLGGGIAQGLGLGKEKNKWVTPVTALALAGVFTGGLTEGFVDDLFAPIRAKGGWGGVVGIKTPGAEEARAIKEANKSPTRRAMEEKIKAREAARMQAFPPP